jgi:hypothetical protein
MGFFWEENKLAIISELETGVSMAFESYLSGAPVSNDPFLAGTSQIEKMFQQFIDTKQMDRRVPGVPTKASLQGKPSRFKSKRGPSRPSFQDTALYEGSFKAWVDWA